MQLDVKNISFSYVRGRDVFHNLSLQVKAGDMVSILGGNGAGKSTLFNCLAGLLRPYSGDILVDGRSVFDMSRTEAARIFGYVPQIHDSTFGYTVLEYVVMGRTPYIPAYSVPSSEDYAIARRSLLQLGLADMENKVFTELSGGEQQLCMIARVLTQEAKIILLDEPTNHLDYGNQYRILNIMKHLADNGYTILTTTHNPDHALLLGGRAAILEPSGQLTLGSVNDLLTEERLSTLYHMNIGVMHNPEAGRNICYVKTTAR